MLNHKCDECDAPFKDGQEILAGIYEHQVVYFCSQECAKDHSFITIEYVPIRYTRNKSDIEEQRLRLLSEYSDGKVRCKEIYNTIDRLKYEAHVLYEQGICREYLSRHPHNCNMCQQWRDTKCPRHMRGNNTDPNIKQTRREGCTDFKKCSYGYESMGD